MCTGCVASLDVLAWSAAGAASATSGARWVRDRASGRSRTARRAERWDDAAAFVGAMGHDPAAVLGPRPGGAGLGSDGSGGALPCGEAAP